MLWGDHWDTGTTAPIMKNQNMANEMEAGSTSGLRGILITGIGG